MDNYLLEVFLTLRSMSEHNYLVGGCVRDLILDELPKDYDIVTDIDINELVEVFRSNGWVVNLTGQVFGVLNISKTVESHRYTNEHIKNFQWCPVLNAESGSNKIVEFEIANFRYDLNNVDGRNNCNVTKITFDKNKSIEDNLREDAIRRDFSVNSFYYDPIINIIYDPLNSMSDIHTKTLRFNGSTESRIREDYLRVFRYFRFIYKGFNPVQEDLTTLESLFVESFIKTSSTRIRVELEKMCESELLNHTDSIKFEHDSNDDILLLDNTNKLINVQNKTKLDLMTLFKFYFYVKNGYKPSLKALRKVRTDFEKICSIYQNGNSDHHIYKIFNLYIENL